MSSDSDGNLMNEIQKKIILVQDIAPSETSTSFKEWSIQFKKLAITQHYDQVGLVIIPQDLSIPGNLTSPENIRTIRSIVTKLNYAREMGTHICVIFGDNYSHIGPIVEILLPANIRIEEDEKSQDIVSNSKEMMRFLSIYSNLVLMFEYQQDENPNFIPILRAKDQPYVYKGLVDISMSGYLFLLPAFPVPTSETEFIIELIPALIDEISLLRLPETPIIHDFQFTLEKGLTGEREKLSKSLHKIDDQLKIYNNRKSILYLRDDPLADKLSEWIDEELGIPTRREEQFIEDLWLCDSHGKDIVISEAKGLTRNVRKEHVTALIQSRQLRELSEDYPSLLIVNTFAGVGTVVDKDKQVVPPNVIEWAVRNNVLIIRTLDLIRLADLVELGEIISEEILELILTGKGWLQVTLDQIININNGS